MAGQWFRELLGVFSSLEMFEWHRRGRYGRGTRDGVGQPMGDEHVGTPADSLVRARITIGWSP